MSGREPTPGGAAPSGAAANGEPAAGAQSAGAQSGGTQAAKGMATALKLRLIAVVLFVGSLVLFSVYVGYGSGQAASARRQLDININQLRDSNDKELLLKSSSEVSRAESLNDNLLLSPALLLAYGALGVNLAGSIIARLRARRAAKP